MKIDNSHRDISKKLRKFRKRTKIKMPAIAEATGIPAVTLYKWEKGAAPRYLEQYNKLLAYLDTAENNFLSKLNKKALNKPQTVIGKRLEAFQLKQNINRQAIAAATGVPAGKLKQWENGTVPRKDTHYYNLIAYLDEISCPMKLSQEVLKAIQNPTTRRRLMDVFDCTEWSICRSIRKNSNRLTKSVAAMQVIREVTGLKDEEILVKAKK